MMASVTERPRTDADSGWTRGSFAVPPSASTASDEEPTGYRYWAHLTRQDGVPMVDGVLVVGSDVNAAALRALKGLASDVQLVRDQPEWAWRAYRQIDEAYAKFLEACEAFDTTAAAYSEEGNRRRLPRPRLTRPDGSDPDAFSRLIARAYGDAVRDGDRAPAKTLAEEAGVPVTTVHRWIRDARRSGHLAPTKRGRKQS
jgi:hypothetical protein